ncbi:TadE/TadG family type IV pilus assembly protein [Solirhodobacter olei]|uniref:TadE/TadG family type IV pilus assembly protein n=1 Tax=Solirhodobacter olei TaxID=2493082 RepID=UPI000FDA5424|nr:TadE/TadG family type IV pilus assembly protein [Solirhodobacter olei]
MIGPRRVARALRCSLGRPLRAFRRAEAGTASVEFVVVFPIIMLSFFMAIETATYALRMSMLERALNITTRELRLGQMTDPTSAKIAQSICSRASGFIADCNNVVMVELQDVSTSGWTPLAPAATCVNRDAKVQPVTTVNQGSGNDMMIIRACAIIQPMFPWVGVGLALPKDSKGGYDIVATSAFVNEPD